MPNFDGGHYFLTALAPIKSGSTIDPETNVSRSHRQMLALALALLPAAEDTAASAGKGAASPFARNTRTHLARFVIIDSPAFNGRVSGNSLVSMLRGIDPLVVQDEDRLTTPYLLFVADFDAACGDDAALRSYTDELWATMGGELRDDIYKHCEKFDAVVTPEEFFAYIKKCQIETTMPFNDYWTEAPKVPGLALPALAAKWGGAAFGVGIALVLAVAVVKRSALPARGDFDAWLLLLLLLLGAAAIVALFGVYRGLRAQSRRPWPAAPRSDLPSILKALFVQQNFTRFLIETQGADDATRYAAFGAFLDRVQPGQVSAPTQHPGVMRA